MTRPWFRRASAYSIFSAFLAARRLELEAFGAASAADAIAAHR